MNTADHIPELHACDRSAEELIRVVQECAELVRKRDIPAIMRCMEDVKHVQTEVGGLGAISPTQALKAIRGSVRAFIMVYIMGDDIEADPDLARELRALKAEPVSIAARPSLPAPDQPVANGASKILAQVQVGALSAVETGEALMASAEKYKNKCAAEQDPYRRKVYGLLALASHEAGGHHSKIARVWTDVGKAIVDARTEGA